MSLSIGSFYGRLRKVHGVCVVESDVIDIEIDIEIVSNRIKSGTRRFYKYIFTTLLFSQYSSVKISIERDLSRKEKEETIQTSLLCKD